jgi:hypothetical protein
MENTANSGAAATPATVAAPATDPRARRGMGAAWAWLTVVVGAIAFQLAWLGSWWGALIVVFLFCAGRLIAVRTAMVALGMGLALGLLAYVPAVLLLSGTLTANGAVGAVVMALAVAAFVWLGHLAWRRLPVVGALALLPIFWTALEVLRSEWSPVRTGLLASGMALSPNALHRVLGVYGTGFVLMALAAMACSWRGINRLVGVVVAVLAAWGLSTIKPSVTAAYGGGAAGAVAGTVADIAGPSTAATREAPTRDPVVVTIPAKNPAARAVVGLLDGAQQAHPEADMFVFTDYLIQPNDRIQNWCRDHKKYVLTAAQEKDQDGAYHDTLVVTAPDGTRPLVNRKETLGPVGAAEEEGGEVVLPVVETEWGKLGVVGLHDFSSRRGMDAVVRDGVRGFLVLAPGLDVWGRTVHEERVPVARVRAAEYGLPVLRAGAGSGARLVSGNGEVTASSEDGVVAGPLAMTQATGWVPVDAVGGLVCVLLAVVYLAVEGVLMGVSKPRPVVVAGRERKAGSASGTGGGTAGGPPAM